LQPTRPGVITFLRKTVFSEFVSIYSDIFAIFYSRAIFRPVAVFQGSPFIDRERSQHLGAISSFSESHGVDGRPIAGPIAPAAAKSFVANTPAAADRQATSKFRRPARQPQVGTQP
jgi:hypothetical protein